MYKVLIVEDEDNIRQGLENAVEWKLYDMEVPLSTENGIKAYEMSKKACPDIAIIDINIPGINGLELSSKILDMNKNAKIIIITGFTSFEIIHEALVTGVFDYLLKPFKKYELFEVVRRAKAQLDLIVGDLQVSCENSRRRSYLLQVRDAILDRIVRGHIRDREQIVEILRDMEISFGREEFKCSLLLFEGDYSIDDVTVNFIGSLVERIFKADHEYVLFSDNCNNLVLITSPKEERAFIYDRLIILRENIMHYLKTAVCIYSGKTYSGAENIHTSYHDIIQLLKYRYIFSEKVIDYSDMEKTGFTTDSSAYGSIQDIIDAMKMNDKNKLAVSLKAYIEGISKEEDTIKSLKKNCIIIITEALRFCIDLNFDTGFIIDHSESMFIKLNEMNDVGNILKWMYGELVDFSEKMNEVRKNKTEKLVGSIMKFIENNYYDYNLNVSYISDAFNMSRGYLSTVFKQFCGKNISDYINLVRVEEAKKFISDVSLKISDIAEKTGFNNQNYFSKVFKSYTGMTPSEFREICI